MISYTVKSGDTLSQIAYRYQTTTAIIIGDNPIIKDANLIGVGWKLKIRTSEEYARDKVAEAKKKKAAAPAKKAPAVVSSKPKGVMWKGAEIIEGQIGMVTTTRTSTPLYRMDTKGKLAFSKNVPKNSRYRVYDYTHEQGGLYILGGGFYAKKGTVSYESVPQNLLVNSGRPGIATVIHGTSGTNKHAVVNPPASHVMPQFEMPGYRRTRMQVKKSDGNLLTMELRVEAMSGNYSNQYSATRTNEGYMVGVGGKNLTVLTLSGFLLDTLTNREADDFLNNFQNHMSPKNTSDYFSAALTTILHKNREYKGVIETVTISDQSSTPLDRKFSMRFLVLSEKAMSSSAAHTKKFTIARDSKKEVDFMSELKNMLANPITGKFNTHG